MSSGFIERLNRGLTLSRLGRHAEALAEYEQALLLDPSNPLALSNRGGALVDLHRHAEAVASFDLALKIQPDLVVALSNRGRALTVLNRADEALRDFDRALQIKPDMANALNSRGATFEKLARFEEALESFDRALAIKPDFVEALNNRGAVLEKLARFGEALASFDRALAIKPDFVDALRNRGVALMAMNRLGEALECFDMALKVRPEFVDAHCDEAACRLRLGDFKLGFRKFEWRWLNQGLGWPQRDFAQPKWLGRGDLRGKSILLHAEQGLGDQIQFLRYAPLVAGLGADVFLEISGVLAPLMSNLPGVRHVIEYGKPLPVTDYHCPLLSLPLAFGTTLASIPPPVQYLDIRGKIAGERRAMLGGGKEKVIGVCWRGSPGYSGDRERSIRFAEFMPLLAGRGVRFVSLQKELNPEEQRLADGLPLIHPGGDFKNTAEMISALDLVISVDTAWAHWAGSLGKPTWILLSFAPHWVWLTDRQDSPWYPTAKLFRQPEHGDWKSVMRELAKAIRAFTRK